MIVVLAISQGETSFVTALPKKHVARFHLLLKVRSPEGKGRPCLSVLHLTLWLLRNVKVSWSEAKGKSHCKFIVPSQATNFLIRDGKLHLLSMPSAFFKKFFFHNFFLLQMRDWTGSLVTGQSLRSYHRTFDLYVLAINI